MSEMHEVRSNIYGTPSIIALVLKNGRKRRWPQPGDRMRFLARNGYEHERDDALKVMSPGDVFTVIKCKVDSYMHWVSFEEIEGSWNGVMFERVDGEKA